jgi:hypothetical protein
MSLLPDRNRVDIPTPKGLILHKKKENEEFQKAPEYQS